MIGVAWPYASGPRHLGHLAGVYLPADIFARYHRMKGDEVLMVSGSDQHGTPITVRAEEEGKTPEEIATRYHREFLEYWEKLGISFDLYTRTGTANHADVVQDVFLTLLKKGHIYRDTMTQPYCPNDRRFLPDRYVLGTCPYCGFGDARGDQCDECGRTLDPVDLVGIRCRLCGTTPQFRETEHFFLRLSAFAEQLSSWVKGQTHWRPNVFNFTRRFLAEGLKDRAITRDIEWGVVVPVPGFENKRIYVWFDAVIGYLSASKEWAQASGDPEKWRQFWQGPTKAYYFLAKDNIPFHTIIWPAMLMGYDGLNLPYDVPANEYLTFEGRQFSTSRRWGVWLPDYLDRYEAEPLRYLLSINMPESSDSDFSWREFYRRNNDELVATYGNLVHRVLTFTHRNFDGRIPDHGEFDDRSLALLDKAQGTLDYVDRSLHDCRFRASIREAMSLAQETNRYLDEKSPWKTIKDGREASAIAICAALASICCLKTVLYPFLPSSSQKLHTLLGYEGAIEGGGWRFSTPPAGQKLLPPEALFAKLDEEIVEEENQRLRTLPSTDCT